MTPSNLLPELSDEQLQAIATHLCIHDLSTAPASAVLEVLQCRPDLSLEVLQTILGASVFDAAIKRREAWP